MYGPQIIARTLSEIRPFGKERRLGQYDSQSDHHSQVSCWALAFDLMRECPLLQKHIAEGKVCIGVNHVMTDFKTSRSKALDLVIATPRNEVTATGTSLGDLAESKGIMLTDGERNAFESLPTVRKADVGSVLVALEAKATMTAHTKALPRLFDELYSSQDTVHGAADQAIAMGLVMVNLSSVFFSPRHKKDGLPVVNEHDQPSDAMSTVAKIRQLPRRTTPGSSGFDAVGILVVSFRNDGSPMTIENESPAPQSGDGDTYVEAVQRAAALYGYRFSTL